MSQIIKQTLMDLRVEVIQSMSSNHEGIRLEINNTSKNLHLELNNTVVDSL